jgi:hypothetical protein
MTDDWVDVTVEVVEVGCTETGRPVARFLDYPLCHYGSMRLMRYAVM